MIRTGIYAAWVVIGVVWFLGAQGNKRTSRDEASGGKALHVILTAIAFILLFDRNPRQADLNAARGAIGLILTIAGVAFAIWARLALGRNWSGTVTIKENHELVRRGPYRIVRHPIYSGALLAILGTAIAFGGWRGFLAFAIALIAWKRKSLTEEQFMTEQFGEAYARYRAEVKALIPWVL